MDCYYEILYRLDLSTNKEYAMYHQDLYTILCNSDHILFDRKQQNLFDGPDNLEEYLLVLHELLINKNAPSNLYEDLEEVIAEYYELVYL
ncbi:hypothetical protein [Mycoplasma sp. P36-A1]|uniref:hypothetical protein n=1 Tax=Mycoplasma sp. P36-A1 TaxID=3252900 RepID=UPI003C3071E6